MINRRKLRLPTATDREILTTRVFDASRTLVLGAFWQDPAEDGQGMGAVDRARLLATRAAARTEQGATEP